jgi:hypothetical protein
LCFPNGPFTAVSQTVHSLLFPKQSIHCRFPKGPFTAVSQKVHSLLFPKRSIHCCFPNGPFTAVSQTVHSLLFPKSSIHCCFSHKTVRISRQSYSPSFHHTNAIPNKVTAMHFSHSQLFPIHCYFLPPKHKHLPQHSIPEQQEKLLFCMYYSSVYYSSVCLNLHIFRLHRGRQNILD